ncbi:phosphatase PAP2 family protein [Tissierella carlieri]|uniref:phosphatase PAP2 family protein n=1 Tax=Tissierella carlieri TaxID=689904 RepID=UPI003864E8CE
MKNKLKKFDDLFINIINRKMKHKYLDTIMYRATNLGGAVFSSLLVLILILIGSSNVKLIGLEALGALTISQIIVHALKRILSRERPYKIIEQLNTFGINLKDYSFPSGHTTASFSIATTIALNIPKLSIVVFVIAIIVGISRIYLGVHYPTDVTAGILLGIGTALVIHFYLLEYIYTLAESLGLK